MLSASDLPLAAFSWLIAASYQNRSGITPVVISPHSSSVSDSDNTKKPVDGGWTPTLWALAAWHEQAQWWWSFIRGQWDFSMRSGGKRKREGALPPLPPTHRRVSQGSSRALRLQSSVAAAGSRTKVLARAGDFG